VQRRSMLRSIKAAESKANSYQEKMSDTTTTFEKRKATSAEIVGGVIGSLLLFIVAYFLFDSDNGIWGALAAIVGVGILIRAFIHKQTAACPNCKHQFDKISDFDQWRLCPSCEKYLLIKIGHGGAPSQLKLFDVQDDYVLDHASDPALIFQVKVPRGNYFPKWPAGCCVCGKEANRKGFSKDVFAGQTSHTTFTRTDTVVSGIPYCEEHYAEFSEKRAEGVRLIKRLDESKLLIKPEEGGPHVLAFRSYKYFKAFRELNGW